jgi:hypothetical protein
VLLIPVWYGIRNYLSDASETGAAAGAVACSFVAFTANRLVLSQKENHMLMFSLLAIFVIVNSEYARKRVSEQLIQKPADKRASAGKGFTDQTRRDAQAGRIASLILAGLILFLLVTCVHMFTRWL